MRSKTLKPNYKMMATNLKLKVLFISFLFTVFFSGFSQEKYYWSSGKRIKLVEDKTSMVVFLKENQTLANIKSASPIQKCKEFSNKRLGNYAIIKSSESNLKTTYALDESIIKSKKNGLVTEENDTIFLSNIIVLRLRDGYKLEDLSGILKKYDMNYLSTKYRVEKLEIANIDQCLNAANEIYESGKVEWCHPNFLRKMSLQSEPWQKQYYLHNNYHNYCGSFDNDVNAVEAWEITKGCSNITVAVLDEGVEDHPDLRDAIGNSRVLLGLTVNGATANGRPGDGEKHGQACAGIIAASHSENIKGIAPNVMIVPVNLRFSDIQDEIEWSEGINWAWSPDGGNADILSNSWGPSVGAGGSDIIIQAIINAETYGRGGDMENNIPGLGAIVVFSSGNNSLNEVSDYAKNSIAVGALNKYDNPAELNYVVASDKRYTNIGVDQDLMAYGGDVDCNIWRTDCPGDIRTLDRTGSNGYVSGDYYDNFSGTSAACPQVSGAAALILSVNPNLTRVQVENILFSTATDLGSAGKDNTYGYGKLNIYAAIKETIKTLNKGLFYNEGLLTYTKTQDKKTMSFTGSPECSIPAGIYYQCDAYRAAITITNTSDFIFLGDGLSGANPNDGISWVNKIPDGSNTIISTFFFYIRYNSLGQEVNKWVPFDPSFEWTRKYLVSPSANLSSGATINSGNSLNLYATNSVELTNGFSAYSGSNVDVAITATSDDIICLPNPKSAIVLKSSESFSSDLTNEIGNNAENNENTAEIIIYPNPSKGNFMINFDGEIHENAYMQILDLNGKILLESKITSDSQNVIFTNQAGLYIVKIINGDNYYNSKIILE